MAESGTRNAVRHVKLWARTGLSRLVGVAGASAILGGLGVFGWQVYKWLGDGIWPRVTVEGALSRLGVNLRAPVPESWTPVHSFIEWLPITTTGVVGGTFLLILASGMRSKAMHAHSQLKEDKNPAPVASNARE